MYNPFRTNKGFVDHLFGGILWVATSMLYYYRENMSLSFMSWSVVLGVVLGLGYEIYQLVFQPNTHSRPFMDSLEDFLGECISGAITLWGLSEILLYNDILFESLSVLLIVCSIGWLFYSWFFRWNGGGK